MKRTPEECEKLYADIMSLKVQGLRNQEIALKLGVNDNTVSRYVNGYVGVRLEDYGLDARQYTTGGKALPLKANGSVARINFGLGPWRKAKAWLDAGGGF